MSAIAALLLATNSERALWPLAGTPLVLRAARILRSCGDLEHLVVVGPPSVGGAIALEDNGGTSITLATDPESALQLLSARKAADVFVVHDAARALAPVELLTEVIAAVRSGAPAALPVTVVSDTVKHIGPSGEIESTVDRETLRSVQTPYGFSRKALDQAIGRDYDPLALWRSVTGLVTVEGHADAFPIDTRAARQLAQQVLGRRMARI
jgi:2-C-methyl-D-erythritol 4-phosphate cytidylyltransferase